MPAIRSTVLLQSFIQACKYINVYISSCCCSAVPPVSAELVSQRVLWCPPSPLHMRMSADILSPIGQWRKASPVAEAQHRQAWRDGGCSLLKIFFFFCKYLTWIIQIRTCWWVADCHFYSHLFRESTENMLQHGHCGPKRTKREFFRRRTHLEPVMWTLGGWLAGQPASGHHTRTWVPRARRLTTHRRNSCHLPGTGSKPDTQKPRSTCL